MPIFQYRCNACSSVFEHLVSSEITIEDVSCIACNSKDVERLFSSNFNIQSDGNNVNNKSNTCSGSCSKVDVFCPVHRGFSHSLS